ncbi:MAG: SufE family protein, partial [Verrucomicrobiota bacterium]
MNSVEQQQLIEDYLLIENPQERFGALVSRATRLGSLKEEEKVDQNLVPGCVSQVWLVGALEAGRCRFR